jgi:hypothetical protein
MSVLRGPRLERSSFDAAGAGEAVHSSTVRGTPWLERVARVDQRKLTVGLLALMVALVCLRSWVFLWFPHSHMDSDQAVFGLMGKDIALGRGYPLFMYGQKYMLAVGSWLCAPLFAAFGVSVTTLKLPMFAMNIACVFMLWIGLRRERALGVWGTALAVVSFAAVGVVAASRLVEHQGGNIEPFFFLMLAFLLRQHSIAQGVVFGVAFLNREFAALGFIALVLMDIGQGRLLARLRPYLLTAVTAAVVITAVRSVAATQPFYVGSGPHGSVQDVFEGEGFAGLFTDQLPLLLGLSRMKVSDFVLSRLHVGVDFLWIVAIAWVSLGIAGAFKQRRSDFDGMATYLILIGLGQAVAFVLLCGSPRDLMLVRYVLLVLCVLPGLTAYAWRTRALRPFIAAAVLTCAIANTRDHVRIAREYMRRPPRHELAQLADALTDRGVRYAEAGYWVSYHLTWLTDERIIVAPPRGVRIDRYNAMLAAHDNEVVQIRDEPCRKRRGEPLLRWYLCR